MNEQFDNVTIMEEAEEVISTSNKNNGLKKAAIGLGIIGGLIGLGTILIKKNQAKIDQARIKRLEKKGYVVLKPTDACSEDEEHGLID